MARRSVPPRPSSRTAVALAVLAGALVFVSGTPNGSAEGPPNATTFLESKSGASANTHIYSADQASISGDGRFVAFTWHGAATGSASIFLRDRALGTLRELTPQPAVAADTFHLPSISRDGCHVAFVTSRPYDVKRDQNRGEDVYVADVCAPGSPIMYASVDVLIGTTVVDRPAISADGRVIAFSVSYPQFGLSTVEIVDRGAPNGKTFTPGAETFSAPLGAFDGTMPYAGTVRHPVISDDGRFVAVESTLDLTQDPPPTMSTPGGGQITQVFRHDRSTGTSVLVSAVDGTNTAGSSAFSPTISADGDIVAFVTTANLQPPAPPVPPGSCFAALACSYPQLYARQVSTNQTRLLSRNATYRADGGLTAPSISGDGVFVAFESGSLALMPGTPPRVAKGPAPSEMLLVNRLTGVLSRISEATDGKTAVPPSHHLPTVDMTGRSIGWTSDQGALLDPEKPAGAGLQVFVRNRPAAVSATGVDFGGVPVGQPAGPLDVTVTNNGLSSFRPVSISAGGDFVVVGGSCTAGASLPPGQSCTVSVLFTPSVVGGRSATVTLAEAGFGAVNATATVTGAGLAPKLSITPASYSFPPGAVGSTSTPAAFTVTNNGTDVTTVTSTAITGDFAIVSNSCSGATLLPGAACPLTATFSPTTDGSRKGVITVKSTGGGFATSRLVGQAAFGGVLVFSPAVVTAGKVTTLVGKGFRPTVALTIGWDNGLPATFTATTDANGEFRLSVLILRNEAIGTRHALVTAPAADAGATAPLLVVLPTYQPQAGNGPAFRGHKGLVGRS